MPPNLLAELQAITARLWRLAVQRNRLDAARTRTDTRDWAKARRERTRQLIELGGLVQKAGLVELLDDDRATLLGALLDIAGRLQQQDDERQEGRAETPADLKARWRRQGNAPSTRTTQPQQSRTARRETLKSSQLCRLF